MEREIEEGNLARTLSLPPRSKKLHDLVSRRDTRAIVADIACKGGSRRPRNAFFAFCRHSVQVQRFRGTAEWILVPGNSRKHLVKRRVEVSEDIKGRDGLGRTGDSVQGSSDGLDVLATTSILRGLELLDKVRTCAIDDIHDDQRGKGDRG